ncbi:MAG: PAS domain-containing protein [Acetobacteraceae bacterium]
MSDRQLPGFDDPALARAVERLKTEEVNRLPFGVILLDSSKRVRFFSQTERRLSGYGDRPAIGLDFFGDIAPCMSGDGYRGRLDRALQAGTVDIEFQHVGDFADRERDLRVRIQSAADGGCWIFMSRD